MRKAVVLARPRMSIGAISPLELFTQVQVGATPPVSTSRNFILTHFKNDLQRKQVTEASLLSMDAKRTSQLLRQLFFDRYLGVAFRLFTFDLEFTSLPRFNPRRPHRRNRRNWRLFSSNAAHLLTSCRTT